MLNGVLWNQKMSKRKIYSAIVNILVTYDCEVWSVKQLTLKVSEATEMNF